MSYLDKAGLEYLWEKIKSLVNEEDTINRRSISHTTFNGLKGSRFVVIGDSYASGYTPETGTVEANGWAKKLQSKLGISDSNFIISHVGGTGFANAGASVTWGETVQTIAVTDPDTIDYVIFCGGYNDAAKTNDEITSGMITAIQRAQTRFPNAKICVGFVGMSFADYNSYNALRRTYYEYKGYETQLGYIYLHGVEWALHRATQVSDSDHYHPNASGNQAIMEAIVRCLMTGKNDLIYRGAVTLSFDSGISMDDTSAAYYMREGRMTVYTNQTVLRYASPVSQSLNHVNLPLFRADVAGILQPDNRDCKEYSAVCNFTESGSKYKTFSGRLNRGDFNRLNWEVSDTNDGHTNFRTASINSIQLSALKLTADLFGQELS